MTCVLLKLCDKLLVRKSIEIHLSDIGIYEIYKLSYLILIKDVLEIYLFK